MKQFLPDGDARQATPPTQDLGSRDAKKEVFISYTWNPPKQKGDSGIPPDYEGPVRAIQEFLRDKPVILRRDEKDLSTGDSISDFMKYGAARPHVIVVHSDKYWQSPYCMYEWLLIEQELRTNRLKSLRETIIPVEHTNSCITERKANNEYVEFWNRFSDDDMPLDLPTNFKDFKIHVQSLIRKLGSDFKGLLDLNLKWSEENKAKVLAELAQRLGFSGKAPVDRQPGHRRD